MKPTSIIKGLIYKTGSPNMVNRLSNNGENNKNYRSVNNHPDLYLFMFFLLPSYALEMTFVYITLAWLWLGLTALPSVADLQTCVVDTHHSRSRARTVSSCQTPALMSK